MMRCHIEERQHVVIGALNIEDRARYAMLRMVTLARNSNIANILRYDDEWL